MTPSSLQIHTAKLSKLSNELFQPHYINNKWYKPAIGAMKKSKLRQAALITQQQWSYDIPHKPSKPVVFKGHKYELHRERHRLRIIDGLAAQPEKLKSYYDGLQSARVRTNDILSALTKSKQTLFIVKPKQRTYQLKPMTNPKFMSKSPLTPQQLYDMKYKHHHTNDKQESTKQS